LHLVGLLYIIDARRSVQAPLSCPVQDIEGQFRD